MRRTVSEVAQAAGVSVRTLHHYDSIGLLRPAEIGDNGYRYYGREELLRLQQILFYRALGLSLAEIGPILDDPAFDRVEALRGQRAALAAQVERHRELIRTIDRTIAMLEEDEEMKDNELYAGISPEQRARWDREVEERFGACDSGAMADSRRRLEGMSREEVADFKAEMETLHQGFAALLDSGAAPTDAAVQALAARHHRWVCRSWTPDAEAYAGLGRFYVEHPEFRAMYDAIRPGLAEFIAAAMATYAERSL